MASVDKLKLNVEYEKLLHDSIKDFAKSYYDKTGVMINTIDFNWAKTVCGNAALIDTSITTESYGKPK